jgi:hypothetical protein
MAPHTNTRTRRSCHSPHRSQGVAVVGSLALAYTTGAVTQNSSSVQVLLRVQYSVSPGQVQ